MSPKHALLISFLLIFYLIRLDLKKSYSVSKAIWIPFIWMFLAGSRTVSQWFISLTGSQSTFSANMLLEGNPIDRAVFSALMIFGLVVLHKRKIKWLTVFIENKWVWLFFIFGAISISWSDYPITSFKRLIKAMGSVVMVLVVLTELRPYLALGVLLRRLAFVMLPLSVLLIKYYPEMGRAYHMGQPMYTGVAFTKNSLGQICLISGVYFSWSLIFSRLIKISETQRIHYFIYIIILPMTIWLLFMADSATSWACFIAANSIFIICRHSVFINKPKRIFTLGIACIIIIIFLEQEFGIKNTIIHLLGRRPDLTDRVEIWDTYLSMVKNVFVGYGFESFYLQILSDGMTKRPLPVHNGYLEMYLNLGIIGVGFIIAWILSGFKSVMAILLEITLQQF